MGRKIVRIDDSNIENKENVIYRFKNKKTDDRYVGSVRQTKKGNTLHKRMKTYNSHLKTGKHLRKIERAILKDPENFTFALYSELPPGATKQEVLDEEQRLIDAYATLNVARASNLQRSSNQRGKPQTLNFS